MYCYSCIDFDFAGKDLLATEVQFSDEYILLAGHLLHDLYTETGEHVCALVRVLVSDF